MKKQDLTGAVIDRFRYDTPAQAQQDFYVLCEDERPLVLVFLSNFGHPISRHFLEAYSKTIGALTGGRLACVVKSDPKVLAEKGQGSVPFTLICDAGGVLYEYFEVETTTSRWKWSMQASKIFKQAKQQGFELDKTVPQLLPLTMLVGKKGEVLYSHYGESLTDLPEDCAAIEAMCEQYARNQAQQEKSGQEDDEPELEAEQEMDRPKEATEQNKTDALEETTENKETDAEIVPVESKPVDVAESQKGDVPLTQTSPVDEPAEVPAPPAADHKEWNKLLDMFEENRK